MTTVFHIADLAQWEEGKAAGAYRWSTRGATLDQVGFIHCSATDDQVRRVAGFVYADHPGPLVVLEIDVVAAAAAGVETKMEDGGTGELFPHLYGALDPSWVVAVHPARFDDGVFVWGAGAA
ncbi:MAG: DUF952 domain-containing protein [Actinomycetes bacterium]|jgi:uncharacterized protein (DUF952 family)|nr:MAG: DUF952 domain-containing protein [Actinomycetota bacterium]